MPGLSEEDQIRAAKYLPRELPKRLFEEDRFLFPETYGVNRVRLLVRDPEWIFAYWDVNPAAMKDLARSLGERALALSRLTLRVLDPVSGGSSDILLPPGARWWYIRTDSARRTYRAELGVTLPSGEFRRLAESNTVVTPRVGPSPQRARRRMSYRDARELPPSAAEAAGLAETEAGLARGALGGRVGRRRGRARRAGGGQGRARRGERRLPSRGRQRHLPAVGGPMPVGYWCPVLHAHLPYVRHPEYPSFLEEDWFFEALTETYVPIVRVLDGLLNDGVEYRLTMTLSPPLVSMMTDELLVGRYHRHLDNLVELARREVDRTKKWQPQFHDLAWFYLHEFSDVRRIFREVYGSNLVSAFRKHRDAGKLEIITCGATHGFFPLMDPVPQAVRAQVQVAAAALPQALRPQPRRDLAARVRLHAGPRGLPARRPASASASSSRTASPTPTRARASASTRRSSRRAGSSSSAATWSPRARSGARSRATRATSTTASSTRTSAGSCRWRTSRTSCPTARGRTSGSSTTA